MQKLKKTDLTNKVVQISEERYTFLLGEMYLKSNDGYKIFFGFCLNNQFANVGSQ